MSNRRNNPNRPGPVFGAHVTNDLLLRSVLRQLGLGKPQTAREHWHRKAEVGRWRTAHGLATEER